MSKGLAKRLSRLEKPAAPVCNSTKDSHVLDLLKRMLELKANRETKKPRSAISDSSNPQGRRLGEAELCIYMLQKVCWYTRDFSLWKISQLKTLHDRAMDLVKSKVPPDEIARQMALRTSSGRVVSFEDRVFSKSGAEERPEQSEEFAALFVPSMRSVLMDYPSILGQIKTAFPEFLGETRDSYLNPIHHHLVGDLSGPGCLNSPYCGPL
jgi:hypothetical protein